MSHLNSYSLCSSTGPENSGVKSIGSKNIKVDIEEGQLNVDLLIPLIIIDKWVFCTLCAKISVALYEWTISHLLTLFINLSMLECVKRDFKNPLT